MALHRIFSLADDYLQRIPSYLRWSPVFHCLNCDAELSTTANFCDYCAAPLNAPRVPIPACRRSNYEFKRTSEPYLFASGDGRLLPAQEVLPLPIERPSVATTSFTRFNDLPCEIRNMIWQEALPGPRIVQMRRKWLKGYPCERVWSNVHIGNMGTDEDAFFQEKNPAWHFDNNRFPPDKNSFTFDGIAYCPVLYGFQSQCPAPTLLYVCRESFALATKSYSRAFGTNTAFPDTWFDFNKDTLYIDASTCPERDPHTFFEPESMSCDLRRVRNLAVFVDEVSTHEDGQASYHSLEGRLASLLKDFGNVKNLTTVARRHGYDEYDELVFMDLMDIDVCLEAYSRPYHPVLEEELNRYQGLYTEAVSKQGYLNLPYFRDLKELYPLCNGFRHSKARCRCRSSSKKGRVWPIFYPTPSFDRKIITTARQKREIDALRENFIRCRTRFEAAEDDIRILLKSRGRADISKTYKSTATVNDLILNFRRHFLDSCQEKNVECYFDGIRLNPASTLVENGLRYADIVEVYVRN